MIIIIGIDPGATGAQAFLGKGEAVVMDFDPLKGFDPFIQIMRNRIIEQAQIVFIEKAQVMPRMRKVTVPGIGGPVTVDEKAGQGAVGMFRYGVHYGTYLGILTTLKIPFQEVHPMTWKKEFGLLRQPKERSIQVAQQLFPSLANQLTRKKDHGRAEALLIAEWGRRHFVSFAVPHQPLSASSTLANLPGPSRIALP